jgi:hypothetical protein
MEHGAKEYVRPLLCLLFTDKPVKPIRSQRFGET